MEKMLTDAAIWVVALTIAELGAAVNQDWSHANGRITGAAALLAVLLAALKSAPTLTKAANDPVPAVPPVHSDG